MKSLKHVSEQPFIAATGLAALVHSTWSLAVLFSGHPPTWDPTSLVSWAHWVYWLGPAVLIAFALDVGQIATSAEIRGGQRTGGKYTTFLVFAAATYYLQWLYIAHHMPALELGPGVYDGGLAGRIVLLTRNAAIWFIPALLPLSTTMYTLSGDGGEDQQAATESQGLAVELPELTDDLPELPAEPEMYTVTCEDCGWTRDYDNQASAKRGLATHQAMHCTAMMEVEHASNGKDGHA